VDIGLLTAFLAPFLPMLLKAGEAAAEEVGSGVGQDALSFARRLWHRVWPSVEAKPSALEAAQDVADQPDDERRRAALEVQLEKLLGADSALAADVERLFADAQAANVVVAVTGDRAVGAGRDIRDSTIVTGGDVNIG
jgi:hypothetical protein